MKIGVCHNIDRRAFSQIQIPRSIIGNQKDLFLHIVEEARNEALLQSEGKTVTYVSPNSGSNDWRQFGNAKDKRSLKSVILRQGQKERIVSDIEEFISNSKWYKDREIPYRRGYLLHGPPGKYHIRLDEQNEVPL